MGAAGVPNQAEHPRVWMRRRLALSISLWA